MQQGRDVWPAPSGAGGPRLPRAVNSFEQPARAQELGRGGEPTGESRPGTSGWDQGGLRGPRWRWARESPETPLLLRHHPWERFLLGGDQRRPGHTWHRASPSPGPGSPSMSSCGPGPAGIRNVPKRDSLLLLAKLYLIQWVSPCTVASPGVINCNISSHVNAAACVSSLCWPADATTLFSDHDDAGKLRAPCLHPLPDPLAARGGISGPESLWFCLFIC